MPDRDFWENIRCPVCGEKRKNTRKNKVWFDPNLSEKKKGKMVYYCTNHEFNLHFILRVFEVDNVIVSVNTYVFHDRLPK